MPLLHATLKFMFQIRILQYCSIVDDCADLVDREKVEGIQGRYVDALEYVIERDSPARPNRLAQVLMLLPEYRTLVGSQRLSFKHDIFMKYYDVKLPDILFAFC